MTIAFPCVRVINRALAVSSLKTLVSTYCSASLSLSLTSILVVSNFRRAALKGQDHDFEDFVFFIPPDCPTSTPVAPRKRSGLSMVASAGVDLAGDDKGNLSDATLGNEGPMIH